MWGNFKSARPERIPAHADGKMGFVGSGSNAFQLIGSRPVSKRKADPAPVRTSRILIIYKYFREPYLDSIQRLSI